MKPISFIHCADLHLDSPFVGLSSLPKSLYKLVQNSTFQSFSKIVDAAIEKKVDFMIIAGDLYDLEDRSIRAQIFFRKEMERLQKSGIAAFLVHGNHDHLGGSWTEIALPSNVHIFPKHVTMIPFTTQKGAKVHIYGFSYPKRHMLEGMTKHYQKEEGADYHIGILHGHDSKNHSHLQYAPFKTSELLEKGFDYWALGHIHQRSILHEDPYILYPGNIQGRHKNEKGEKGCYFVEMDPYGTEIHFIPTSPIIWDEVKISPDVSFENFDDLYLAAINLKEEVRQKGKNMFLDLAIDRQKVAETARQWLYDDEFLRLLQEDEERRDPFVWVHSLKVEGQDQEPIPFEGPFFAELEDMLSGLESIQEPLALLYSHPRTRKFLDSLTPKEEEEIKDKAIRLIQDYLQA